MDDTTFDLKADSAAIIFHSDMSTELILPKMDDEETVDFDTNQNIFILWPSYPYWMMRGLEST